MSYTTIILAVLYTLSAVLAVAGIALTVSVFMRDNQDGTGDAETRLVIGYRLSDHKYPGRLGFVGPILIASSVLIGLAGNFVSLWSSSENAIPQQYCVLDTYDEQP
jgi:hypothetical protein